MRLYITRGALTIATKDSILCKTIGICNFNENDANDNLKKLVIGSKTSLCPLMSVGLLVGRFSCTTEQSGKGGKLHSFASIEQLVLFKL